MPSPGPASPPAAPPALRLPVPAALASRAAALAADHLGLGAALGRWARQGRDSDAGFDLWMAFAQEAPDEVEGFLAEVSGAARLRLPAQLVRAAGRARAGAVDAARGRWDVLVDAARASGDVRLLAHALREAGRAHGLAMDTRRALPCFAEAIPLAQALGDARLEVTLRADEAAVLGQEGSADDERRGAGLALQLAVDVGDAEAEAHCRVLLAVSAARSGELDGARAACAAARRAARLQGLPYVEALALHGEALVAARRGELAVAEGAQAAALDRLELLGKRATVARQQLGFAEALTAGGQAWAAAGWAARAVAAAQALGVRPMEARAWAARAAAAEALGDANGALRAWRACAALQQVDLPAEVASARQQASRGRASLRAGERARAEAAARAAAEAEAAALRACVETLVEAADALLDPGPAGARLGGRGDARLRLRCLLRLASQRRERCALVLIHVEAPAGGPAGGGAGLDALAAQVRGLGLGLIGPGRWDDDTLWALVAAADPGRVAGIARALRLGLGPAGPAVRVAAAELPAPPPGQPPAPGLPDVAVETAERALRLARGAGRDRVEVVVGAEG